MNQRPVTFKVGIVKENGKLAFEINRHLQKFINSQGAGSTHLIIILPQPREYIPNKKAPHRRGWVCDCGLVHSEKGENHCKECGMDRPGRAYSNIRKKFGNMRIIE